jgi:hypothetical protein
MSAEWGIRCGTTRRTFAGKAMTELAEPVAFGIVLGVDVDCPFDHSSPEPPTVENDFIGDATKLASNMEGTVSTVLHNPFKPKKLSSISSPNDDPKHAFFDGHPESRWPVEIHWKDEKSGASGTYRYPVTCAAHHLIPAQESLKRAEGLHQFMIKKGASETVAVGKGTTTLPGGIVYSDVGYCVNGSENGVFLPGNYAVTALTMDDPHWTPAPSVLSGLDWEAGESPDNENVGVPKVISSPKLTGDRHQINNKNRKWQYVKQAVKLGGQFHDRHKDYSDWIVKVLEEIGTQLESRYVKSALESACDKCAERAKKFTAEGAGVPTPFGLLARLNGVSSRTSGFLSGGLRAMPVVTSKWGVAHILAKRAKNVDAD